MAYSVLVVGYLILGVAYPILGVSYPFLSVASPILDVSYPVLGEAYHILCVSYPFLSVVYPCLCFPMQFVLSVGFHYFLNRSIQYPSISAMEDLALMGLSECTTSILNRNHNLNGSSYRQSQSERQLIQAIHTCGLLLDRCADSSMLEYEPRSLSLNCNVASWQDITSLVSVCLSCPPDGSSHCELLFTFRYKLSRSDRHSPSPSLFSNRLYGVSNQIAGDSKCHPCK